MGFCTTSFDLEKWLAQVLEDVVEPELDIIDAHHHLYDCRSEPRGDLTLVNKLTSCMNRAQKEAFLKLLFPASAINTFGIHNLITDYYSPDEFFEDVEGHKVTRSVCVEFQFHDKNIKEKHLKQVDASKLALEKSEMNSLGSPNAHVCHVDLTLGKEKVLEALAKHKEANPYVSGLRHQLSWHPSKTIFSARDSREGLMSSPEFREGLSALKEHDLVFDAWLYHTQLPELNDLAKEFNDQTIVLDHIGTPLGIGIFADKMEEVKAEWAASITELAKCPNVYVKLSGILMPCTGIGRFHEREMPPTSDEVVEVVLPYFQHVIEQFGVDRCMFASNFPVDKVSCSYRVLFNAFKKICNKMGLSQEQKTLLFHGNALKIYRPK